MTDFKKQQDSNASKTEKESIVRSNRKNMSLYDCDEIIAEIETAAEKDGEITDEQLRSIVEAHTQSLVKLKSLCGFIKYLEHGIAACKSEKDRINNIQRKAENRLQSAKAYLVPFVKKNGRTTIDTFTLSVRKSQAVELSPDFRNPYFCEVVKKYTPDKKAIKEALRNDEKIEGATLVTNFNLQLK